MENKYDNILIILIVILYQDEDISYTVAKYET